MELDDLIQLMRTCGTVGDVRRQLEIYKKQWPTNYHVIAAFYQDVKDNRTTPVRKLETVTECALCKQKLPSEEQPRQQRAGTGSPADLR